MDKGAWAGLFLQLAQVELNRILQAQVDRVRNQRMPDRHFKQVGYRPGEIVQIFEAQVVAPVDSQSVFDRLFSRRNERGDRFFTSGCVARSIGFGIELDPVCTGFGGGLTYGAFVLKL